MALTQLATATLTNQALSATVPQLLLTYTEPGTRIRDIGIDVFADQIQGNGNYIAFCTQQLAGAGSAYETGGRATVAVPSGVTAQQFPTMPLRCFAGSVIKVYLLGLAGDTTTPDIITTVTEQFVATDVNGAVTVSDKTGFSLSAAGILAIWNQLTADGGILVNTFAAKLRDWVLGTDKKALISTDAQDLSATFDVNAKLLDGAAPNNLAAGAQMDLVNSPNAVALAAISTKVNADLTGAHGAGPYGGAAGTGFYTVVIPCAVNAVPADGVEVRVTNDSDGLNLVAQALSDTNGNATVYLDAGTYYVFLERGGDDFPNPTEITVP